MERRRFERYAVALPCYMARPEGADDTPPFAMTQNAGRGGILLRWLSPLNPSQLLQGRNLIVVDLQLSVTPLLRRSIRCWGTICRVSEEDDAGDSSLVAMWVYRMSFVIEPITAACAAGPAQPGRLERPTEESRAFVS